MHFSGGRDGRVQQVRQGAERGDSPSDRGGGRPRLRKGLCGVCLRAGLHQSAAEFDGAQVCQPRCGHVLLRPGPVSSSRILNARKSPPFLHPFFSWLCFCLSFTTSYLKYLLRKEKPSRLINLLRIGIFVAWICGICHFYCCTFALNSWLPTAYRLAFLFGQCILSLFFLATVYPIALLFGHFFILLQNTKFTNFHRFGSSLQCCYKMCGLTLEKIHFQP